jgi:hypothetical protein
MQKDESTRDETKNLITYMNDNQDFYSCANYSGAPEFDIFNRDLYNVENDDDLPSITLTTNMGVNELPPLPSEHTLNYQEFHPDLEKWTIFRGLPMMMKYDAVMN